MPWLAWAGNSGNNNWISSNFYCSEAFSSMKLNGVDGYRARGLLTKVLRQEAQPRDPTPYPFHIPILTEKIPLSYNFYWQMVPFHIPGLELCILNWKVNALSSKYSLHDRRFMSQAGRTRYFARSATRARSARRGEEKNKAPVRSPLFLLFHQCSTVYQVDGHADWSISTTWWWRSVIKMSKQNWRPWVGKKR